MNILDIILLIVIAWTVWNGIRRGFVLQVARFVGLALGLIVAFRFSPDLSLRMKGFFSPGNGTDSSSWLSFLSLDLLFYRVIAFALLFFLTAYLVRFVARLFNRIARLPVLSMLNRVAGLLVSLIQVSVIIMIVVHIMRLLPGPKTHSLLEGSFIAAWVINQTPALTHWLQDWLRM